MAKKKNTIQKPERGLGQAVNSIRSSARRAVVKEQKERRKRILDDMRGEAERTVHLHNAEYRKSDNDRSRAAMATLEVVRGQQQAVVDSYGIEVPIHLSIGWSFRAFTDYRSIRVQWSHRDLPDFSDNGSIAEAVIAMRGVTQHELGHNLHSIRPTTLWEHASTQAAITARGGGVYRPDFSHTANILEDQRMESRMVRDVPRLAAYFTVMCNRWLKGDALWVLVAGRSYLPDEVRSTALAAFSKPEIAEAWLDIVNRYKGARSVRGLAEAVLDGMEVLDGLRTNEGTNHEEGYFQPRPTDEEIEQAESKAEGVATDPVVMPPRPEPEPQSDEDGSEASESGDSGSEGEQEQEQGQSGSEGDQSASEGNADADGESDSSTDSRSGTGATTGGGDSDPKAEAEAEETARRKQATKDAIKKAVDDAMEGIKSSDDGELDETVEEIRRSIDDFRLTPLPSDRQGPCSNEVLDLGRKISERMRLSLQQWVTAAAPVWQSHQEHGVIDPLAWRTHRVGERDYHRSMTGTGSEGLDLHLTLMADASGSMLHQMGALSAVMYGTAAACDELGIDRTMVLWSDNTTSHRVWDGESASPVSMESAGGTDPTLALDDMTNHNVNGRGHHLVIVFTDGQWGSFGTLQQWGDDNRKFILVKFGPDAGNYTYGADHSIYIPTIEDMQYHIAAALDDTLASIY